MKIFNKEQDKEKVYVQMNDIMELTQSNIPIPASIIDKVFGHEMLIVDDTNRDDFVEFDKKEEIDFFKKQEWILDYKKYRDLSDEDLKLIIDETTTEMNEIAKRYNNLSFEEKEKNQTLYMDYTTLSYKCEGISKILMMRKGEYDLKLPMVPDSDGFSLGCDDPENPYKLCVSLNPNKYLLYRTDDVLLNEKTLLPANFIQTGLCIAFMQRKNVPQSGSGEVSFEISDNNKYLIIDTKIKEKKQEKEEVKEEKGFKKYLKRIFKKR